MRGFLKNILESIRNCPTNAQGDHSAQTLHLATAALMIELCRADQHVAKAEIDSLRNILASHFGLEKRQLDELVTLAYSEADAATSLYEFTSVFNDNFTYPDKVTLISQLWEVAWADGNIDRFEDHLIRKVADLLYVSHSDFIRCKLVARDGMERPASTI